MTKQDAINKLIWHIEDKTQVYGSNEVFEQVRQFVAELGGEREASA